MKAEAAEHFREHPMDVWRFRASMKTNGWTGAIEDDAGKYFNRHPSLISDADLWRWRAAVEALRESSKEGKS